MRWPDKPWVLVGTQDQLLSRALNRGYAMSRFEWPVRFGLLNQDCHWIIDEVQLMGPGLWTTSQLDWMRHKRFESVKPCRTTWMSATVGSTFLATTDRQRDGIAKVTTLASALVDNDPNPEALPRRKAMRAVSWFSPNNNNLPLSKQIADDVETKHRPGTLSLVVCNTVETAREVFLALTGGPPRILITSRFRRQDRERHELRLLDFEAKRKKVDGKSIPDDAGLICVSTQVVEAGVDISAHQLWSELPPWPSVIQRLGRLNRDGQIKRRRRTSGRRRPRDGASGRESARTKQATSRSLKSFLMPCIRFRMSEPSLEPSSNSGEAIRKRCTAALQPTLTPMPRALDVHGLFSTERDVHGGFTDVRAFVRGPDTDADVTTFWREWPRDPPPQGDDLDGPEVDVREEGCQVAFFQLRDWLKARRASAWVWIDLRPSNGGKYVPMIFVLEWRSCFIAKSAVTVPT